MDNLTQNNSSSLSGGGGDTSMNLPIKNPTMSLNNGDSIIQELSREEGDEETEEVEKVEKVEEVKEAKETL